MKPGFGIFVVFSAEATGAIYELAFSYFALCVPIDYSQEYSH